MTRQPYSWLRVIICVAILATTALAIRADLTTVKTDKAAVEGATRRLDAIARLRR